MKPETLAIHAGAQPDPETRAVAPPIHLATTFEHGPAAERYAEFQYQRESNPTQNRLEEALAAIEVGASAALAFASGMAAISAMLESLPNDCEVLIPDDCYAGLRALGTDILSLRNIRLVSVDMSDVNKVGGAISSATRMIWAETPSNPKLKISDMGALAKLARRHDLLFCVDNTFASPALQNPLVLGADVVMHSSTKYIGGHSDVLGGALIFARRDELFQQVMHRRHLTGSNLSPFACWLTLRGIRTLHARMRIHCNNARQIAAYLAQQPAIAKVNYPGLVDHPGHELASRQMKDFGGMLSIEMAGGRSAALALASNLKLSINATSLGGVESLIEHRASVEGDKPVSPQNLLRLSIGIEHEDDLIADLAQALKTL